jgi:uncharacterized protein (TIGR02569 family)
MVSSADAPPPRVLAAFGAAGPAERMAGGQGRTWLARPGIVLKRVGLAEETAWRAEVLSALPPSPKFRVALPVSAGDGAWTVCGWEAWHQVAGAADLTRHDEILSVCEAFHATLRGVDRPAFLDLRDDPWTYGERVAWQELPIDGPAAWVEPLERLGRARRVVDLPAQPVHGDASGNVLFAAGMPPAVIDWPVYFRPASWATAIAAVDLITWAAAPAALLDRWTHLRAWNQMLVRALMYRIATNVGLLRIGAPLRESPSDYRPAVAAVISRLSV